MNRRRWLTAIGAVLVVAFVGLWVVPMVRGPVIDCGPLDQAACNRAVADIIARHRQAWKDGVDTQPDPRLPPYLPVLSVTILPASTEDCYGYEIHWQDGGVVSQPLC